jgi:hypothetical protein
VISINLLPKTLRRRRRADPYTLAVVGLPLLALLGAGWLQTGVSSERARLEAQERDLRAEQRALSRFIGEQSVLQNRRSALGELQDIAQVVQRDRVLFSQQLFAMLETRPPAHEDPATRMAFQALEMRALDPAMSEQRRAEGVYEDLTAVAEMDVSGVAGSAGVVADYVRELQRAPNFGVVLRDLAREEGGFYTFNLTVGAAAPPADSDASATADGTGASADNGEGDPP